MLNTHELMDLTLTTMADEDTWLSVQQAIHACEDVVELRLALEEVLIIASGLAVQASGLAEVDTHYLVDFHYQALQEEVDAQD
jgi:regulator of sigma D